MNVFLTPQAPAVTTPHGLKPLPRYSPGGLFVTVSGFSSPQEREQAYAATKGSRDWLWSGDDDLRFHRTTGELDGVFFSVPEEVPPSAEPHAQWLVVRPVDGGLRMDPPIDFALPPAVTRWVSPSGKHIVCCNEANRTDTGAPRARLRIAGGFDLLFLDGLLAGWMLESPERWLVEAWETPARTDENPLLAELLRDYLTVVSLPRIDRLPDGDPALLADLSALARRAHANAGTDPRYGILHRAANRLLEDAGA